MEVSPYVANDGVPIEVEQARCGVVAHRRGTPHQRRRARWSPVGRPTRRTSPTALRDIGARAEKWPQL